MVQKIFTSLILPLPLWYAFLYGAKKQERIALFFSQNLLFRKDFTEHVVFWSRALLLVHPAWWCALCLVWSTVHPSVLHTTPHCGPQCTEGCSRAHHPASQGPGTLLHRGRAVEGWPGGRVVLAPDTLGLWAPVSTITPL